MASRVGPAGCAWAAIGRAGVSAMALMTDLRVERVMVRVQSLIVRAGSLTG
jgi:hypothetical protein